MAVSVLKIRLTKCTQNQGLERTRTVAKISLKTFDLFCEYQGLSRDDVIKQYTDWVNPKF